MFSTPNQVHSLLLAYYQAMPETERVLIPIILTFYLASEAFCHICSLLPCRPSLFKSQDEISFKGLGAVTPRVMNFLITFIKS
jgi:hypothetical protein